jgi:hypothetical protein
MQPKSTDFAAVKDYTLHGILVGFEDSAANTTEAQSFTITFQPNGAPIEFAGPLV